MSFLQVCATVTRFPHAGSTLWERDQLQRRRRVNERVVRDDRERKEGAEKRRRRRKYKQNWRVEERRRSPLRSWVSTSQFTEFTVNRLMDLHNIHTWHFVQQYSQLSSLWCVQAQHFGRDIKNASRLRHRSLSDVLPTVSSETRGTDIKFIQFTQNTTKHYFKNPRGQLCSSGGYQKITETKWNQWNLVCTHVGAVNDLYKWCLHKSTGTRNGEALLQLFVSESLFRREISK